jgi:excisionase family DNA binding protein
MQYLTIQQAADALAVDHKTIRRMLPRIGAVDIAEPGAKRRTIRIPAEALERFLQGCAIRPPAPKAQRKPTEIKFERRR